MKNSFLNLTDDKGTSIEYEVLDYINYNEELYLVIYKADRTESDVLIVKVHDLNGTDKSEYIIETDKNVVNSVFNIFKSNNAGKIEFTN